MYNWAYCTFYNFMVKFSYTKGGSAMKIYSVVNNPNPAYIMSNSRSKYNTRTTETIGDTSFNSLNTLTKKTPITENLPQMFDKINQWKRFCHKQIMAGKLDVIA